jgi:hypothetical protein
MTNLTPYAAAKLVNAALIEAGIEKVLPPQMFYNYTTARVNKGKTPLIPTTEVDGKIFIADTDLAVWLQKYVAKNSPATVEA